MENYNEVIANGGIVCYNSLGKKISCFKTGGSIDVLIRPINIDMLSYTLNSLINRSANYIVLGQASNILLDDAGYRGSMVLTRDIKGINIDGRLMHIACGETLMAAAKAAKVAGLSGLERLSGIPGTIGGAVTMNAGCFGDCIADVLEYADVFIKGKIERYSNAELSFGYRKSILREINDATIISAGLRLSSAKKTDINALMQSITASRKAKQPNEPSLGSVFKNCGEVSAAQLIEESGFKGVKIGGAQVSERHANFIINIGNATSADYKELCAVIAQGVKEKKGAILDREVIFLSENGEKY